MSIQIWKMFQGDQFWFYIYFDSIIKILAFYSYLFQRYEQFNVIGAVDFWRVYEVVEKRQV